MPCSCRSRRSTACKPKCKKGKPCGKACIPKCRTCHIKTKRRGKPKCKKGKPCGKSCIKRDLTCHIGSTSKTNKKCPVEKREPPAGQGPQPTMSMPPAGGVWKPVPTPVPVNQPHMRPDPDQQCFQNQNTGQLYCGQKRQREDPDGMQVEDPSFCEL